MHVCTYARVHIHIFNAGFCREEVFAFGDRQTQETGETGNATDLLLCALDVGRLVESLKAREPAA